MSLRYIPGWLLMLGVTLASGWVSQLVEIGSKHPLEASALAVLFGLLIRNSCNLSEKFHPGIKANEKPLILGIVLMGASMNFGLILSQGSTIVLIILATMIIGFVGTLLIARYAKLSGTLAILLSVGTTICGGTAVAVTAPLLNAPEEETSYAVTTIALWGIVALLLYPAIAHMIGVSEFSFGVFAGTAIHSTPQVVGAGFIFSDLSGKTATAVKLVRNCFMAPLALILALWHARSKARSLPSGNQLVKAFPWFLFAFFLMSWFNTKGYFSEQGISAFENTGRFLIVVGMAGVGLNTDIQALRSVGIRPVFVGLFGALVVGGASAFLIKAFL